MADPVSRARSLRKNGTEAEKILWQRIRSRQLVYKFYRQHPLGGFIVDFVCPKLKLILEVDGGQHAENPRDEERTAALNQEGYEVVRFWNNDVMGNIDGVLAELKLVIERKTST